MKRFWKNIAILLALPLLLAGCTTDYPELNQNGLPQASDLDVAITVDQETNYVTFTLKNRGVVPMWIFGEEKVDGSASKKYAYTQNGISLRIRDAGVHSVEVKAYNVNGISVGSKIVEFELENTYHDPFDPAPYFKALSGDSERNWIWNSTVDGHFGCDRPEDPFGSDHAWYWQAKANDKEGCGLYDDVMTFNIDGTYTYDPGTGGTVYVNKDSGYKNEYNPNDGNDYQVPIESFSAQYWFEQSWSDAGIEQIDLCFDKGANVSYIPFLEALDTPRYHLMETSSVALKKEIRMYIANAEISWLYDFTARDAQSGATFDGIEFADGMVETLLTQGADVKVEGIDLEKIWVDPDFFTAVDGGTLKFNAVSGEYRVVYDEKWLKVLPLKNGEKATYENDKALWVIGDGGGKPTVDKLIDWNTDNALPMARIAENKYQITLAMKCEGGSVKIFGQAGWGTEWTKDKYGTFEGNGLFNIPETDGNIKTEGATVGYYTFTVVDNDGILDMTITKAKIGGGTIYDPTSPANMWLSTTCNMTYFISNADWGQIADPGFEADGNNYTITLPDATIMQWQAQVMFHTTMSSSADKTYDFYLVMTSSKDHPGATIKLTQEDNDNIFYFDGKHPLTADEEFVYKVPNMPGIDIDKLKLVLDFGGNEAGTVVNVKDIIFQEHQEAE